MRLGKGTLVSGLVMSSLAVGFGATAFACTNLATISTPSPAAPAGTNIAISGASFAAAAGTPVVLHWNGVNGPEVARTVPDKSGNIAANFTVPKADAGYYVIVATQAGADGKPVYGTPARSSFQVVGPDGAAAPAPAAAPRLPSSPNTAPDSNGVVALTFALGAAGLALFGAGLATTVRQSRRRAQPVASRSGRD
ncbi:MAG: hypothetical protein ACRDZW_01175 [Acidimicrobiales bacterium]